MIFLQNTEHVRQTKDLNDRFTLVSGFHYDQQRSNATHRLYSSTGAHISLDDYNNNSKIDLCVSQGCDYVFNLLLTVTGGTRSLTITVSYGGGLGLNGLFVIDALTLHYDGETVTNHLQTPLEIKGAAKIIFPVTDGNYNKQLKTHQE